MMAQEKETAVKKVEKPASFEGTFLDNQKKI